MTKQLIRCFVLLVCILTSIQLIAQEETAGFAVITPENVTDLELGYALPGICRGYDPSGQYVITQANGVYDVYSGDLVVPLEEWSIESPASFSSDSRLFVDAMLGKVYAMPSGELLFSTQGSPSRITPDGRYVVASSDGVYDTETGERLYTLSIYAQLSPAGTYMMVNAQGVIEVSTGNVIIESDEFLKPDYQFYFSPDDRYFIDSREFTVFDLEAETYLFKVQPSDRYYTTISFSPDSQYIAVADDGIFTLPEGERVLTTDGAFPSFSPDGTLVALSDDGVYEVGTWEQVLDLSDITGVVEFTNDNNYLHFYSRRVMHIPTGDALELEVGDTTRLSPNQDLLISLDRGIYDLETFEQLVTFDFEEPYTRFVSIPFNSQQTVMARSFNFVSNAFFYDLCLVYGVAGTDWAYRSGLVETISSITAYDEPNGERVTDIFGMMIVLSQTEDGAWYRVVPDESTDSISELVPLWVRAEDVTPISMPDGIPIEDPNA
ncbi:MAG: WD40 repeat domain-containing protein [Chloroflexota bacterium]